MCVLANVVSFVLCFIGLHLALVNGSVVLLRVSNDATGDQMRVCALKKPVDRNSTAHNNTYDNRRLPFANVTPYDGCRTYDGNVNESAMFMQLQAPFNCSFNTIATYVHRAKPAYAIIGSNGPIRINTTLIMFNISFVFMPQDFADRLVSFVSKSELVSVIMEPLNNKFDFSLIVIWAVAMVTIFLGALWTKHEFKKTLMKSDHRQENMIIDNTLASNGSFNNLETNAVANDDTNDLVEASPRQATINISEEAASKEKTKKSDDHHVPTLTISYKSILVLLIIVVAMLLLLYFFFDVMIYFIFLIFGLGAASSLYRIGSLFFERFDILGCKLPENNLPLIKSRPEIRKIILGMLSITFSIVWFVFRHHQWSWIMQNIMAVSMALNALSFYRISTYKSIAILLSVFLVYDIFMVFVTPAFTKGTSIMEAVAFGGRDSVDHSMEDDWSLVQFGKRVDTSNRLPVVIVVPHLDASKRLCDYYYDYPFSLLGLGDILIPGLSINYGLIFDYSIQNRYSVYFLVNIFGYFIGLMLAFIGLLFMNTAQPALLYLCPMLLIASIATSLIRKEFKIFWTGQPIHTLSNPTAASNVAAKEPTDNNESS